jgi:hypothetical protein
MTITDAIHQAVLKVPASAWTSAIEPDGEIRDGAWVAELDGDCFKGWRKGTRLIVRKERPHPGMSTRTGVRGRTDTRARAEGSATTSAEPSPSACGVRASVLTGRSTRGTTPHKRSRLG